MDGRWSCDSLPAEGRTQQESTGLDGKKLITQAVSKVKDKCGKQTLVENQKHERERPLSRLNVPRSDTSAEDDSEGEECGPGLSGPLCAFPSPLDAVAAIKMFASGLCASFLIPRESSRLFSPPLHTGDLRCDDANSRHDVSPPLLFTSGL